MRLLLAANNQATRRNEIIKSSLQLGSSSNRYTPRLPQQETKLSTKQLPPTDPILGPENLLKTGFAQKGLPSMSLQSNSLKISWPDTAKYCSLSGARMLGKYLAIAHILYCFLLFYFHFWNCPGGSRNIFSIFYVIILWASPRTK